MSRKKLRTQEKQKAREEKLLERVRSGQSTIVAYEEKKKKVSLPNRKSSSNSPEEEIAKRQDTAEKAAIVYRQMLPGLLQKLSRIEDPRQPKKVKHKQTVLMLYGILMFVYHTGSRREANRNMSEPIFWSNVMAMFPELESMPHADTLARLLEKIDVEQMQECLVELLQDLMRKKKFKNYLINKRYLVAVDGTQKFFRRYQWDELALKRHVGGEEKIPQFYVYVLDSVLILDNGIVLPVISEILENKPGENEEITKQDCERKAFERISKRLYKIFGKGNVTLLADGLYACGPVIKKCRDYEWDYMIVFKEDSIPELWQDATGVMSLEPDNSLDTMWGEREQHYIWANHLEYQYGRSLRYMEKVNVVICYEIWTEDHIRSTKKTEETITRYAWISSRPLTKKNVFMRCTKMARYRWKIENNFLIEKHEGYFYEHCYSYDWKAMKGFHYLMKMGHFLNSIAVNSEILIEYVAEKGIRGFISDLYKALSGSVLDKKKIVDAVARKQILKLRAS